MKQATSHRLLLAAGLFLIALPAMADSTTNTSFTLQGKPMPGRQITVHAVVTGNHLAWVPPTAVRGGQVQITLNGQIVLSVESDFHNSSGIGSGKCIPDATFTSCITYKYTATQTNVDYAVTLPRGVSEYTIGVRYSGDTDSHASDAPSQTLRPVNPGAIAAATSVLLD